MNNLVNITPLNVFLIWLAVVSLTLFFYVAIKLKKTNKKLDSFQTDEDKRWGELENKAQNDYQEIIHAANKKAEEIISQANLINHENMTSLNDSISSMLHNQKVSLETSSEEISKKHEVEINELNSKIITLLSNVYKDIEYSTRADLENYKESIKKQTFEAEQVTQQRMKEEYEKLEKEIEEKKQQKLEELQNNIYKIITIISKDIIGKSLDLSSHQELILKSLDAAKKEGIL